MAKRKTTYIAYFDGAARNNPGPAGAGCIIVDETGSPVWKRAVSLGHATNNEAEYNALILLLEKLEKEGLSNVLVRGDSKLVVEQASGRWQVNKPGLIPLAERAKSLVSKTGASLEWIPREKNAAADEMSNLAIDEGDFEQFFEIPEKEGREKAAEDHADPAVSASNRKDGKKPVPVVADYFLGPEILRKALKDIECENCPPSSRRLKSDIAADIGMLADFVEKYSETDVEKTPDGSIPRPSGLFHLADGAARLFESMEISSMFPLNIAFCAGKLSEAFDKGSVPRRKFFTPDEREKNDHEDHPLEPGM